MENTITKQEIIEKLEESLIFEFEKLAENFYGEENQQNKLLSQGAIWKLEDVLEGIYESDGIEAIYEETFENVDDEPKLARLKLSKTVYNGDETKTVLSSFLIDKEE